MFANLSISDRGRALGLFNSSLVLLGATPHACACGVSWGCSWCLEEDISYPRFSLQRSSRRLPDISSAGFLPQGGARNWSPRLGAHPVRMTNFAIVVMTGHLIFHPAGIQKTYTARDIVDSCPRL